MSIVLHPCFNPQIEDWRIKATSKIEVPIENLISIAHNSTTFAPEKITQVLKGLRTDFDKSKNKSKLRILREHLN